MQCGYNDPKDFSGDRHPGRHRGRHRRAHLPPVHRIQLERRAVSSARSRSGRAASRSGARSRAARSPPDHRARDQASRLLRADGRDRPRRRARAGDRTVGQLLQPGAVRTADDAAVGPRDRPRAPAGRLRALRNLPSDVPLRVAVVPARRSARSSMVEEPLRTDAAGRCSRCTSRCTRSGAFGSRRCACDPATRGLRHPLQPVAFRGAVRLRHVWFVWLGRRPPNRQSDGPETDSPGESPDRMDAPHLR